MAALDPALVRLLTDTVRPFVREEIRVIPGEEVPTLPVGLSKIGGMPDVPADFVWPVYEEGARSLPLAFLAQIDCRIASAADRERLLPRDGMLSFFYELDTMKCGFDPADRDLVPAAHRFLRHDLLPVHRDHGPCRHIFQTYHYII